jgi:hypothetical protein
MIGRARPTGATPAILEVVRRGAARTDHVRELVLGDRVLLADEAEQLDVARGDACEPGVGAAALSGGLGRGQGERPSDQGRDDRFG